MISVKGLDETVTEAVEKAIPKNNNLKIGQMASAIASPLGLVGGPTATAGVVSALIPFAQGIGFAIPIEPAMWIAEQLMERGEVVRPWISINAVDVNPKLVAYYNLPVNKGVVITKVVPPSATIPPQPV